VYSGSQQGIYSYIIHSISCLGCTNNKEKAKTLEGNPMKKGPVGSNKRVSPEKVEGENKVTTQILPISNNFFKNSDIR
tara:strand:- start:80 stop:313 length:234 start_codon:yes stop_codon:yes gene_type:complete